jgi:hypothetical protein
VDSAFWSTHRPPIPIEPIRTITIALITRPLGTQLIVLGPFFGIREHFIGLVNLFEAFLSLRIARIDIGVTLAGELTKGPLDRFLIGIPADT